jgi:hypothetical protein
MQLVSALEVVILDIFKVDVIISVIRNEVNFPNGKTFAKRIIENETLKLVNWLWLLILQKLEHCDILGGLEEKESCKCCVDWAQGSLRVALFLWLIVEILNALSDDIFFGLIFDDVGDVNI